jgi:hypothetical protein
VVRRVLAQGQVHCVLVVPVADLAEQKDGWTPRTDPTTSGC